MYNENEIGYHKKELFEIYSNMIKEPKENICITCGQDKTDNNNCLQCEYETNMLFI